MRKSLSYLRITWAAFCGLTCVLLVVLWVRSYSYMDSTQLLGQEFTTWRGQLILDEAFLHTSPNFDDADVQPMLRRYYSIDILTTTADDASRYGQGWAAPFWLLIGAALALTVAPWLRWRFSLRTLLIATTIIAILSGLTVWLSR